MTKVLKKKSFFNFNYKIFILKIIKIHIKGFFFL